jgi:transposase
MEFFVGLDVSLDETHICVVDEGGRIIKETRSLSEPQAIAKAIRHKGRRIEHVGLETGNLSQWLYEGLVKEGSRSPLWRHVMCGPPLLPCA